MKKINVSFIIFLCFSFTTKSQDVIKDFLVGPVNDSEKLIEGYMNPFGKWLGAGLNSGWYNTGKPHQFPGFDVTLGIHLIKPAEEAMSFNPNLNQLIINSNNGELPTFIGEASQTEVGYINPLTNEFQPLFNAPGGINWQRHIPMPYLQGSVGLIKKTEILFRLTPKINAQDLKMGYWGLGFKHDIKQWIPGIKILPFNLSVLGAYASLNSDLTFNPGQNLNFNVKAFHSNIVLSKKILGFTPYIGVGYQYSKSTLALNGEYTILDWDGEQIVSGSTLMIANPVDLSFGGVNGLKTTIGARLKFLLFTFHIDWTRAEYDILTIGIGVNSDIGARLIGGNIGDAIIN